MSILHFPEQTGLVVRAVFYEWMTTRAHAARNCISPVDEALLVSIRFFIGINAKQIRQ